MTATPLPESGQTIPSLPRSLYLGAQDQPHWSKISDTPDSRRRADSVRSVEITRRRQQLAAIHDSLHHLRAAATAVGNLDRNGLTLAAADNVELSLEHTASAIATLVADMRMAAASYTEAELRASTPAVDDIAGAARRDVEARAEREAEDLDAAADSRAADQVVTALVVRREQSEAEYAGGVLRPTPPTPAVLAAMSPSRSHRPIWPHQ